MDSSTMGSTAPPSVQAPATVAELKSCLNLLRSVRYASQDFFSQIAENKVDEGGDESAIYVKTNQDKLEELIKLSKQFQTEVSALSPALAAPQHTLLDLVSLNPLDDRTDLTRKLGQTYRWWDKLQETSRQTHQHLFPHLNRSHIPNPLTSKKRKPHTATTHVNVPQHQVDTLINAISKQFQDMTFSVSRTSGNNSIVQVTLGRVLKGVICLRGLLIESVVFRGYGESNLDSLGRVDPSTPSPRQVFQRVSDNATAAMLHFCSPFLADISIRSFFTWLHSFITLFSATCSKCGSTCNMNQPPTWREFRTLLPYHQHCRP